MMGNNPTHDDQYRALGWLAATFGFLETTVTMVVWAFFDPVDQRGALALTTHASFTRLCAYAEAIAQEKLHNAPEAVTHLKELLRRAQTLNDRRNRLIHSMWVPEPGDTSGPLARIKLTGSGKFDLELISSDDLNLTADEIFAAAANLMAFVRQHGHPRNAWPDDDVKIAHKDNVKIAHKAVVKDPERPFI